MQDMTLEAAPADEQELAPEPQTIERYRKPGAWLPGQSGNPNGRPKKGESMTERLRAELERVCSVAQNGVNRTNSEAVAANLVRLALSDEPHAVRAAELLMDRTDGKVTIPVSVSNVTLVLSQDDYDAVP